MNTLQNRLQEALQQVRLGIVEVKEARDKCLQEMKEAISPLDIMHMSKRSEDVHITVQNNDKTEALLKEYEEAHRQLLEFIEVKRAITKALL